jgi:hypothetical protein
MGNSQVEKQGHQTSKARLGAWAEAIKIKNSSAIPARGMRKTFESSRMNADQQHQYEDKYGGHDGKIDRFNRHVREEV